MVLDLHAGLVLQVGEQILEVNGQSFKVISHDEAVHVLKTGRHLQVKVREVGRLPHARTLLEEGGWSQGPDQSNASASSASSHHASTGVQTPVSAHTCTSR